MKKNELHWLAGILEGEGSFVKGPPSSPARIGISMASTDKDVIEKVANLIGANFWECKGTKYQKNPHWKTSYTTKVTHKKAYLLMRKLKSLMGVRRQSQIQDAMDWFEDKFDESKRLNETKVIRIMRMNMRGKRTQQEIADHFGLKRETVNRICNGKAPKWNHLLSQIDTSEIRKASSQARDVLSKIPKVKMPKIPDASQIRTK